ncbi:GGDEF domain-containing protein [Chitinimonas sp.]|uniref:GGDEF domain-containing protein n=1 Tax=Chitinimonas sp. TaxID=1934313 RepID=UPI0035B456E6
MEVDKAARKQQAVVLACLAVPVVGYLHYLAGEQLEFHLFFLLPVIAVAWHGQVLSSVMVALLSITIWALVDWLLLAAQPSIAIMAFNIGARLLVFLAVVVLVIHWRNALQRETRAATTDALTGLANRRAFHACCADELARAQRHGTPLASVFIDIDGFKAVNDRHGHEAGDALLRKVADVLGSRRRSADLAARLGGDEFALLLPQTTASEAEALIRLLQQRLDGEMRAGGFPVTFSIGIAAFASAPTEVDVLLKRADALMYEVKHGAKNGIRLAQH